ncbi:DUF2827 family protein [Sphingomonas pituitosa]|uniref:DUF2827 family protein n=1 Tax=Sphingomonas pituitosa TaxID=99597 RepID=UPI000836EC65|nr:DUF2827 family protein [Sphingomonas pituitosa]
MRIGISIFTQAGQNIWNNGIGQNVYHLATLCRQLPFVEAVYLINCGDQQEPPACAGEAGKCFRLISLAEATDLVDVVIELSGAIDREWGERFRARGGRVAFNNCGQPYVALVDHTTFSSVGCFLKPDRCDEVWLLEKDAAFLPMMRSMHRCPVTVVPYLWGANFLRESFAGDGEKFGYKKGTLASKPASVAIFEPNLSPIKMGVIPFLIAEAADRRRPGTVGRVDFMNTAQMVGHPTFSGLMNNSDIYRDGKVFIQGRDYFSHVMGRGGNIVISHQLDCAQNYLYLDAISGGYPLVHNSPLFAGVGYYYPESDVAAGAEQVLRACREHDRELDAYNAAAAAKIVSLSPFNRRNQDAYARRLLNLVARKEGR